ncbi:PREDICTED: uncharacterized protein LOC104715904 [Camelina sativa]|uniref:Uncharacterized protein LOC104715904 n=1 Tax=Camelina sativa TaxID=90675 RepID=A0ABM0TUC3_CAMSA|nr:PREDICTED: uncharacterized protein LOC104715904 [Camelina sativa]
MYLKSYPLGFDDGQLCIDLRDNLFAHLSPRTNGAGKVLEDKGMSQNEVSSDSLSEEDDNPEADSDQTHVSQANSQAIVSRVFPCWNFEGNYEFSDLGKIWLTWHPSVQVTIICKSLQMITCLVKLPFVSDQIVVSVVYASSTCSASRRSLWAEIVDLSQNSSISTKPWTVLGDFNQILLPHEHSNLEAHSVPSGMRELSQCLLSSSLSDLPYCGSTFTWTNKHSIGLVAKKLDRVVVNDVWLAAFPTSLAVFGEPAFSDHSPGCIFLDCQKQKRKKPFKFLSLLNQNPEFGPLIKVWWDALQFDGTQMFKISKKLKLLKNVIRDFSKVNYSGIEKRVQEAYANLLACQQDLLATPSSENVDKEKEAHRIWTSLALAEESFLKQRSHDNDQVVDSRQGIQNLVVDFYKGLFGGQSARSSVSVSEIADLVTQRCSSSAIQILNAPYSPEEIKKATFSLPRNKAPGPDGYCVEFFTAQWETVGSSAIEAVTEFFRSGKMLKQWNATIITLIPKTPNAQRVGEFRPIACCNTLYKIVSKLLANRLKRVIPDLVSNSQSAFIPGRLLVENVLLATELVQGYNQKNISQRGMLKVDLKKAFDSVIWEFIINTLKAMEFPAHFISLIKQCISTASFSICINGELCGHFTGSKGLRQGDSISPYLFVLVMEVFSQMLRKAYNNSLIGAHANTSNPQVTHLAFADDIMVFFDGKLNSLSNITGVLHEFSAASGLHMNKSKTDLYLAGVTQVETSLMASLGFNIGSLQVRYLGLPLMHRKLRLSEYRPLLDALTKRFSSWAARALSYAGRLQLLSSVIHGTLNFWMSAFILPKGCIKKVESLCRNFLWNGDVTKRGSAKVAWSNVCLPKEEGGLGLRNLSFWNRTLCLKLIWRLFSASDSLWALWLRNTKIKDGSFWAIDAKKQSSWTWKAMLNLRHTARHFLKARLGNGQQLNFWYDCWTPFGPLIDYLGPSGPNQVGIPLQGKVAHACSPTGWNLRPARSNQALDLHIFLATIQSPLLALEQDSFFWMTGPVEFQMFSTKRTWEEIRPRQNPLPWTSQVWFKGAIPRHAFMMWLLHLDRLPTKARLASWDSHIDATCCLCGCYQETRDHLFLHCKVSEDLWSEVTRRLGYRSFSFHTWDAFTSWMDMKDKTSTRPLQRLVTQATVYALWWERNTRYHHNISTETTILFKGLDKQIRDAILAKKARKQFKAAMALWLKYI